LPSPSPSPAGGAGTAQPFTLAEYRELVERTASAYPFADFSIVGEADLASRRFCLLRHDVDYSPSRSLRLARIEAELGVATTYTVQLNSLFYNALERGTRDQLRAIADLGHQIGLHFDAVWHGIADEAALNEGIAWEAATLGRALGVEVRMFSFHNTTPFTMACRASRYGGLWNAYAGVLQEHVSYTSDSNGFWRFRSWRQALDEDPERLQVLTHPGWWDEEPATPAERISRIIEERSRKTWSAYAATLSDNDRENRTGVSEAGRILPALLGEEGQELLRLFLSGRRRAACDALEAELGARSGKPASSGGASGETERFEALAAALESLASGDRSPA
jgi:hypothetical protein